MHSEYIDKINTQKKYFTIICMVIMVVLFNWILKDFSANILIHKLLIYLLFCFSLYIGLVVEKDWFSPFSLFSLFYFSLFIYNSNVSPHLLPKISDRSIFLILIGSSSFIFGLIAFKNLRRKLRSNKGFHEKKINTESYQPAYSYWILLLFGLTPTIISLASKGIPAMMVGGLSSKEIQDIRISFPIPILSMFTCLTNAALITAMSTRKKKVIM